MPGQSKGHKVYEKATAVKVCHTCQVSQMHRVVLNNCCSQTASSCCRNQIFDRLGREPISA